MACCRRTSTALGDDMKEVPDSGALHLATRDAYRAQVLAGMPMGDGWYLRAFPVWFARRGNFGVLLSQAKALSAASRLRGDSAATGSRAAAGAVDRRPKSVRAEHDVRRRLRLGAAVQCVVRRLRRLAAGGNAEPRDDRSSLLAVAEHVRLQGSVGAPVEPVAVADGRSDSYSGNAAVTRCSSAATSRSASLSSLRALSSFARSVSKNLS